MSLIVPQRRAAESHSFPMEPSKVRRWLGSKDPLTSFTDAREIQRGLKHSNRLVASTGERRQMLECFMPYLTDLYEHLSEQCLAQPLPLTSDFQQSANLLEDLLREEAYAFKILVSEEPEARPLEIGLALQSLVKLAELSINSYRYIDEEVLHDAQQLFARAEQQKVLDSSTGTVTIAQQYCYILLLDLADTLQVRTRQMPFLMSFLMENLNRVNITREMPSSLSPTDFAIGVGEFVRPTMGNNLLPSKRNSLRWIDLEPLNQRINVKMQQIQENPAPSLGADTLERRTLARLQMALNRNRRRRSARSISYKTLPVIFGHNEICAAIKMAEQLDGRSFDDDDELFERSNEDLGVLFEEHSGWIVTNHSSHGLGLVHENCQPGSVQVGQLVGLPGAAHTRLGVVRWVKNTEQTSLELGLELLSKSVMAVGTVLESSDTSGDGGLVFACKVHTSVVQTIMLQAYQFREGDTLTVSRQDKSRAVKLGRCLQHNGLFGHFVLSEI